MAMRPYLSRAIHRAPPAEARTAAGMAILSAVCSHRGPRMPSQYSETVWSATIDSTRAPGVARTRTRTGTSQALGAGTPARALRAPSPMNHMAPLAKGTHTSARIDAPSAQIVDAPTRKGNAAAVANNAPAATKPERRRPSRPEETRNRYRHEPTAAVTSVVGHDSHDHQKGGSATLTQS